MKKALITGISGQDGSYLAELLLGKGYAVHGLITQEEASDPIQRMPNLHAIHQQVTLHPVELSNYSTIKHIFETVQPDECYHFAAQSFVSYTRESEFNTITTNINGTHNILSALAAASPKCKLFFATSSEMFGLAEKSPQDENTPINPRSVYGVTKAAGYFLMKNYRNIHNIFACNGILYNHESERRGPQFVTRKITMGAANIKLGKASEIRLGNIEARRDWGFAPDYVRAMWLMLQQDTPDDYVIGTGQTHSVKDFLEVAFETLDLNWKDYVVIDPQFYRPAEAVELRANPQKACEKLGWAPEVSFRELVQKMVLADYHRLLQAQNGEN